MNEKHIPDMLNTGKFHSARLCRVMIAEESGGTTYAVQYSCADAKTLDRYYKEDAAALRQEGIDKFGERVVAFRTELDVLKEHISLPESATAQLFVYGTLLDQKIQKMVFQRNPEQRPDALKGYVREDQKIAGLYADLNFTGDPGDSVDGILLILSQYELHMADHYEGGAYRRIEVELQSGSKAWTYVGIPMEVETS